MRKLRVLLQEDDRSDTYPRWHILHSSVIDNDTTPEIVEDILDNLRKRIGKAMDNAS